MLDPDASTSATLICFSLARTAFEVSDYCSDFSEQSHTDDAPAATIGINLVEKRSASSVHSDVLDWHARSADCELCVCDEHTAA